MNLNENYFNLKDNYLFATITEKVNNFTKANPNTKLIRLGIGDVTLPLCNAAIDALHKAVDDMAKEDTFHGYGPYEGYDFLRDSIKDYYKAQNVEIDSDEIFIGDGAKNDISNILDLFAKENTVLIPDPVYPVYQDTNIMDGRSIKYLDANIENSFLPLPNDKCKADIIYICSPNNPTGAVYSKEGLKAWVDFAKANNSIILFDAAYEAFISDPNLPHSIYEIPGANECAIEFCSLSKTAGFTGVRSSYCVVSKNLSFNGHSLYEMWLRHQSTKYNGASYIIQKGAAAVFSQEGLSQVRSNIDYYKNNAKIISKAMDELDITYFGGKNSPYIWLKCPYNMTSWEFFDFLLNKAHVVGTPGAGFGKNGEGFFRLTAFGDYNNTVLAVKNIKEALNT